MVYMVSITFVVAKLSPNSLSHNGGYEHFVVGFMMCFSFVFSIFMFTLGIVTRCFYVHAV
jgi:hypothetical protein